MELGTVRPHPGYAHTLGYMPGHRLRRVGYWLGLGLCHTSFLPINGVGWALLCVLLECAFLVAHFSVLSCVALQNIYIPKLVENVS